MGVDEPQMVQTIVSLIGSGLGVFFFLCFFAGLVDERIKPLGTSKDIGEVDDQDLFAIATGNEEYLTAHATFTPIKPTAVKKERKPRTQKVAPKAKSGPDSKLLEDCAGALSSLGEKKGKARRAATQCLTTNPHITTVEDFLREVLKR